MKITFFNENPPNTIIAPDAFRKAIGQKVPIRNTVSGEIGEGTLLDVQVVEGGIEVTYETNMNLGVSINFPMRVERLTSRMRWPVLAELERSNVFASCVTLGHVLDEVDKLEEELKEAHAKIVELKCDLEESERRWDEHSCMEGHICE